MRSAEHQLGQEGLQEIGHMKDPPRESSWNSSGATRFLLISDIQDVAISKFQGSTHRHAFQDRVSEKWPGSPCMCVFLCAGVRVHECKRVHDQVCMCVHMQSDVCPCIHI